MYAALAFIYTMFAAVDGFAFPGGQDWYVLWSVAAVCMIVCEIYEIISE